MPHTYITDGAEIYRRSFATIRAEAALDRFSLEEEIVTVRMIHAAGMVGLEEHVLGPTQSDANRTELSRTGGIRAGVTSQTLRHCNEY